MIPTITHFYNLWLQFLIVSVPANRAKFIEVVLSLSLTRFNVCRTAQGRVLYMFMIVSYHSL